MTMARIDDNNEVIEVGLPKRLQGTPIQALQRRGWRQVKGTPKPPKTSDELRWVYGQPYTYNADEDAVYGTWSEKPIPAIRLQEKREAASLSRSLFKLALLDAGFLDDVQAFVEQTSDQRIKIMWEDSGSFDRLHPDLIRLAAELGYTDEQLDVIFGVASAPAKLNVNTASETELTVLSGVGPAMAQAIVNGRPWSDVTELATISGISQSMIDGWDIEV